MIFVRLRHRFPERSLEWVAALHLFGWGSTFLVPTLPFDSPSYIAFANLMDQRMWGVLMAALGFAWLAGLFINGTRAKVTSTIRAMCATGGFVICLLVATGFAVSGAFTPQILTFLIFAAASLYSVFRAMVDHGAEG